MDVEEVQNLSASGVHRNGQNMSAAQTPAAVPGSTVSCFHRLAQTTSVLPSAEAFTAWPVDIPTTASAAAVRTTLSVRADVTATAPDAEALTAELLVCGEPECENRPCFAEPGRTSVLSHPLLPCCLPGAWRRKTCNRFSVTHFYHTQRDSFESTVMTPNVITPLRYTTRGGERSKIPNNHPLHHWGYGLYNTPTVYAIQHRLPQTSSSPHALVCFMFCSSTFL